MAPSPPTTTSNIRAFVRWREPSVYAGEEIECIITFRNIAAEATRETKEQEEQQQQQRNGPPIGIPRHERRQSYATSAAAHSRKSSIAQSVSALTRVPSAGNTASVRDSSVQGRGHRPALSLSVKDAPVRVGGPQSAPVGSKAPYIAFQGHGRSLSIMSLGSDRTSHGRVPSQPTGPVKRPPRSHARSASLQTVPRPPPSPWTGPAPPRQPSPLFESSTPPTLAEGQSESLPIRPTKRRHGTVSAGHTPQLARPSNLRQPSPGIMPAFQFPAPQDGAKSSPVPQERPKITRSPSSKVHFEQPRNLSARPPEGWTGALSNLHPISRVMSETSTVGTPRTSSEFYSISNHSDETLPSEIRYQTPQNGRMAPPAPSNARFLSRPKKAQASRAIEPETLMMGYAQTMGSFVLDGGLVNAAPFEEVKRKGVQGGGGVVGVEQTKHSSGMFGAFSWGNIGESLGGLLGGEEKSSIAQMKATAESKSIPLLSTPQNLLFVDLNLAPGESKSFAYRFLLPRGLPPTHRGRAIKVSYHLLLGVQRPEGQTVKRIEIPFRVLGSYNARGEALGHDLMSPYILLQDVAKSSSVAPDLALIPPTPSALPRKDSSKPTPKQGLEDFLRYTERLQSQPKHTHADALISPTSPAHLQRSRSSVDQSPASVKEAVDLAIIRSNYLEAGPSAGTGKQPQSSSANRFNIARSGQPVAVLTLLRPAYRLGESIIGTIDFTAPSPSPTGAALPPQAPTYALLAELESAERIDASLAMRSSTSIHRVTRRIHASVRENALFARQVSFALTVPATATPSFETTGVSLAWRLRVEFTTQRLVQGLGLESAAAAGGGGGGGAPGLDESGMLEELGSDERGTVMIAKERLVADTFEISVPLKVFGVPGADGVDGGGGGGGESEAIEV